MLKPADIYEGRPGFDPLKLGRGEGTQASLQAHVAVPVHQVLKACMSGRRDAYAFNLTMVTCTPTSCPTLCSTHKDHKRRCGNLHTKKDTLLSMQAGAYSTALTPIERQPPTEVLTSPVPMTASQICKSGWYQYCTLLLLILGKSPNGGSTGTDLCRLDRYTQTQRNCTISAFHPSWLPPASPDQRPQLRLLTAVQCDHQSPTRLTFTQLLRATSTSALTVDPGASQLGALPVLDIPSMC
jgi:hypothetical protein